MDGCGNQCKKISNCGHHDSGREVTYRRDEIESYRRSYRLGDEKIRDEKLHRKLQIGIGKTLGSHIGSYSALFKCLFILKLGWGSLGSHIGSYRLLMQDKAGVWKTIWSGHTLQQTNIHIEYQMLSMRVHDRVTILKLKVHIISASVARTIQQESLGP